MAVVYAAAVLGGLGLALAAMLAAAHRFFRVHEDPRLDEVEQMLPGNNCGACGNPGCRAFSEILVAGKAKPGKCTVATPSVLEKIAAYLGVDVGAEEKRVARLKCAGAAGRVPQLAPYHGISTCRAAVLVNGGGRACAWGCLGLADCERACTFDAIHMKAALPVVDIDKCTACNDCVEVCPLNLFVLAPLSQKLFVQCNTPLSGAEARARCAVACDACGKCAADAPGTVEMVGGLPVVHYDRTEKPTAHATRRCPTGAIKWIEGRQFADLEDLTHERERHAA